MANKYDKRIIKPNKIEYYNTLLSYIEFNLKKKNPGEITRLYRYIL